MSWPLAEACARAEARRALGLARGNPAVVVAVALAWASSVPLGARLGSGVASALAPQLGDIRLARAAVAGLVLPCVAAGAVLGVVAPRLSALGGALASAPVGPVSAQVAIALPRSAATGLLVGPPLIAAVLPLAAAAPGRRAAVVTLLAMLIAGAVTGAVLAEVGHRVVRAPSSAVPAFGGCLAIVGLALVATETTARALVASPVAVAVSTPVPILVAALGAFAWPVLAASRPPVRPRSRDHLARRRLLPVVESSAFALVARPPDVRLALAASAAFGVVGVALAAPSHDATSGVLLGGGVAALTAGIVPLSVAGRVHAARWLWSAAGSTRACAAWASSAAAALLAPCLVVAGAGAAAGASVSGVVAVALAAALSWQAGIAGGALFPRGAATLADDTATLAAFLVALGVVLALGAGIRSAGGVVGANAAGVAAAWVTVATLGSLALFRERLAR